MGKINDLIIYENLILQIFSHKNEQIFKSVGKNADIIIYGRLLYEKFSHRNEQIFNSVGKKAGIIIYSRLMLVFYYSCVIVIDEGILEKFVL